MAKKEPSKWQQDLRQRIQQLHIANAYGLFRVMTTTRPEIEIAGSNNRRDWQTYNFRWKPGPTDRSPDLFFPHMPRLDWQMWFAGLRVEAGTFRAAPPWFIHFIDALAEERPDVIALLEGNPFPDKPPRYLRLRLQQYTFTSHKERKETGNWWNRELLDPYTLVLPVRP